MDAQTKERAIQRLNGVPGVSLGTISFPGDPEYDKYRRGLLAGDERRIYLAKLRIAYQPLQAKHELINAIMRWRAGAPLPPDIRRCKHRPCSKFFLVRNSRPSKACCSERCGRNFRSSKSMNLKNAKLRQRKLVRLRIALRKLSGGPDWKERAAQRARVTKNFVSIAVRLGEIEAP
jgi:hypothetical protein